MFMPLLNWVLAVDPLPKLLLPLFTTVVTPVPLLVVLITLVLTPPLMLLDVTPLALKALTAILPVLPAGLPMMLPPLLITTEPDAVVMLPLLSIVMLPCPN